MSDYVTLTLRCSNSVSLTPYVDLEIQCVAIKPRQKDEEGSEVARDIGSYHGNGIATRTEYECIIKTCTVRSDSDGYDFGNVYRWSRYLRSRYLAITGVADSPRVARTLAAPTSAVPWWTSGNALTYPHYVRRVSFDFGDGDNGSLDPVLVLEDSVATVGVTIS